MDDRPPVQLPTEESIGSACSSLNRTGRAFGNKFGILVPGSKAWHDPYTVKIVVLREAGQSSYVWELKLLLL